MSENHVIEGSDKQPKLENGRINSEIPDIARKEWEGVKSYKETTKDLGDLEKRGLIH